MTKSVYVNFKTNRIVSAQRAYQVSHLKMGLCIKCSEPSGIDIQLCHNHRLKRLEAYAKRQDAKLKD